MNWRKGFFRTWIVVSLLWVGATLSFTGPSIVKNYRWLTDDACKPATPEVRAQGLMTDADIGLCDEPANALQAATAWTIGPPLGMLIAGASLAWVFAGFGSPKPHIDSSK